ncbi:MAG TPA: hypothetical protein PKG91_02910 [Bacilli bacterium]|nr:hypothetical protein [Bacilli bacterium]
MRNFWILLKYNLINTLNLNKLNSKTKEGKLSLLMVILFIVGGLFSLGLAFLYMFMIGSALAEGGFPELILLVGIVAGFMFILLMTITKANSTLFRSRDYDLLMSLPLKPSTIIASKLVYILAINYLLFAFIYFPTIIVYTVFNTTDLWFWLLVLPTFFLVPLLPIAVSSLLAYLFGFITPKIKYKNLTSILFSLLILFLIMYASFQSSSIEEDPSAFALFMKNALVKIYYPGQIAFLGMLGSWQDYLLFTLISVVPFVGFVWLLSKNYMGANSRGNSSYINKNYEMKMMQSSDQKKAMIKKELKRYFGSFVYVLNTIMGPMMSTFLILFIFFGEDSLSATIPAGTITPDIISMIIVGIAIFTMGMTSTTASSISIEGKQFWILKSLPLSPQQIFNGKLFVNYLISFPFVIINGIIALVAFRFSLWSALFMFLIPGLVVVIMSYAGLYFNLLLPRFDYDSDVKAVKQGMSVLMTMLTGFVTVTIVIVAGVLGVVFFTPIVAYIFAFIAASLIAIVFISLVQTHGVKLFNRING